jgi:integrin beta 3
MALTSGHCVNNRDFSTKVLRFGDQLAAPGVPPQSIDSYEIASVEVWDFRYDLAFVKLLPNSKGVLPGDIYQPLKLSNTAASVRTSLYLIGHAAGAYKKYVDNCSIFVDAYRHATGKKTFGCDCDAFGGMSGSPVFDATTHKVIGILWGGQRDIQTFPVADNQHHEYVVPMWLAASATSFDHGKWPPTIRFAFDAFSSPLIVELLDLKDKLIQ